MTTTGWLCCEKCGTWYDDHKIPEHCETCATYLFADGAMFEPDPIEADDEEKTDG